MILKVSDRNRFYAVVLLILIVVFFLRVLLQLVQYLYPQPYLPEFKLWQSGALSYEYLLVMQILILIVAGVTIKRVKLGELKVSYARALLLLLVGGMYFFVMLIRLIVGLFILPTHPWFSAHIPTLFHFVLATWILVLSRYHFKSLSLRNV